MSRLLGSPLALSHAATSDHSQAGLPPTVHRGFGKSSCRNRHWSTAFRPTPALAAISTVPTGSTAQKCKYFVDARQSRKYNTYNKAESPTDQPGVATSDRRGTRTKGAYPAMQGANTINLLCAHGRALADVIADQGTTAEEAEGESVRYWLLAAKFAGVPLTADIKAQALFSLRESEANPNPFAGFPNDGGPF